MVSAPTLIFTFFTEWLIVYTYLRVIYEKRNRFSWAISMLLFTVLMLVYRFLVNVEILNIIFTLICYFLCVLICFKSNVKSAIFQSVALGITCYLTEIIALLLISAVTSIPQNSSETSEVVFVSNVAICRVLYFFVCRFFIKFSEKKKNTANLGKWASLAILPLSSLFVFSILRMLTKDLILTQRENIVYLISLILLLIANIAVYIIYERSEKSSQKLTELELVNQKNDINMQYLQLLEAKNNNMSIMAHDYKKHLSAIKNLNTNPEIEKYITQIIGSLMNYGKFCHSGNQTLDVIIDKYLTECRLNNVLFTFDIKNNNLSQIEPYDLVSILDNLLDNAVEAAKKSEEREVWIETDFRNNISVIIVSNSCEVNPLLSDTDLSSTTKRNKSLHGFGLKSVKTAVKKYSGDVEFEYIPETKQFIVTVMLEK